MMQFIIGYLIFSLCIGLPVTLLLMKYSAEEEPIN